MAKVHLRSCPGQHFLLHQPESPNLCHYHRKNKISETSDDFKTQEIIPKILNSFDKATPKKIAKIGNNIPDHYLMKSLLRDFYENPVRDQSKELLIKNKKDKVTSTTGLDKLARKDHHLQCVPCKCHRICNKHFYDPQICNPNSSLREIPLDVNELPIPEVPKCRKHNLKGPYLNPNKVTKGFCMNQKNLCPKHHCCSRGSDQYDEVPTKDCNVQVVFENSKFETKSESVSNCNDQKSTEKILNKGFVKDQVEKYNSLLRNVSECNKIFESVKHRIPNYVLVPTEDNKSTISNDNDWNGSVDSNFSVRRVHFPKETKQAMSTLIEEQQIVKTPEKSHVSISSGACSKNLLCLRGDHDGPCHKIS